MFSSYGHNFQRPIAVLSLNGSEMKGHDLVGVCITTGMNFSANSSVHRSRDLIVALILLIFAVKCMSPRILASFVPDHPSRDFATISPPSPPSVSSNYFGGTRCS
jgi:hypothetical protein